jgi:hypothetical protein
MRTTRIELDGDAGHLAIERPRNGTTIRIDSIIREPAAAPAPGKGLQAWKTWELPATVSDDELFQVATEVQLRTDGCTGTNSMIHDYFREMQRFQA